MTEIRKAGIPGEIPHVGVVVVKPLKLSKCDLRTGGLWAFSHLQKEVVRDVGRGLRIWFKVFCVAPCVFMVMGGEDVGGLWYQ